MKMSKFSLCVVSAVLMTAGFAVEASARSVADNADAEVSATTTFGARSAVLAPTATRQTATSSRKLALNPQPLPPGDVEDHPW